MSSTHKENPYVIIASVNKTYLNMLDLWLKFFEKSLLNESFLLIVFDKESQAYADKRGLKSSYIKASTVREIYVRRMTIIKEYLVNGYNVVHTDADAYWLKPDIFDTLKLDEDIAFSIGHGIPKSAIEKWGFSLCCGFYYLPSNVDTIKLFDKWIVSAEKLMDDQIAFNNLLIENDFKWSTTNIYKNEGESISLSVKVRAISYDLICRKPEAITSQTVVFHPAFVAREEVRKYLMALKVLRKNNLIPLNYYLKNKYSWKVFSMLIRAIVNRLKRLTKKAS